MNRPKVTDYFDKNQFGHIESMDVDFAAYQSALNEHIDFLNEELERNKKSIIFLHEELLISDTKIQKVKDSLMTDEEIWEDYPLVKSHIHIGVRVGLMKQRNLVLKAMNDE